MLGIGCRNVHAITLTCLGLLTTMSSLRGADDEIAALKREVAALKADVSLLRKEVAYLRYGPVTGSKATLTARLDAAQSIMSASERETAFAGLAVDAARWGDTAIVKKAIANLNMATIREETMYRASLLLAQAGEGAEAVAMAKDLTSSSRREKALARIAKGEIDD